LPVRPRILASRENKTVPIYEYECTGCRNRFEVIQKFSDPPKRSCPQCRSRARRLISAPGIQFKGSGWYVTDYARKKNSSADSDGSESSSSEKPAEAKGSDTKQESSGPSKSPPARRRAPRRNSPKRRSRR
jgi:putative FmdB family regulatory protein